MIFYKWKLQVDLRQQSRSSFKARTKGLHSSWYSTQTLSQKCKGKQTSGKGKLLLAQEKTDACDQFYTRVQIKVLKAKQRGCIFETYPYSK